MRVLFDQATPVPLRQFWKAIRLGPPLRKNGTACGIANCSTMRYQQNLTGRKFAIILLGKQQWPDLKAHVQLVVAAVSSATPGAYTEVEILD